MTPAIQKMANHLLDLPGTLNSSRGAGSRLASSSSSHPCSFLLLQGESVSTLLFYWLEWASPQVRVQVRGSSSEWPGSLVSGIVSIVVAVAASTGSPLSWTTSSAGLPSCLGSWPSCWSPGLAPADAVFYQAVVVGRQRRWQAPDVPVLDFLVSGSSLRIGCSRTALRICMARASRASILADVEVVLGCLLVESLRREAAIESTSVAA